MPKQTPLEKANELINQFKEIHSGCPNCVKLNYLDDYASIFCSLIVVQEVIDSDPKEQKMYEFWVLVKKELEKMI